MRIFLKVPAAWANDYTALLGTLLIRAARKRLKAEQAAEAKNATK